MIVSAPAKVNLTLEVTAVEPNGYHLLDTIFAWVELEDTLDLETAGELSLEMVAEGVELDQVAGGPDNLVIKAVRALEQKVGRPLPTRLRLTKRIPAGGGLGGGSADAAATLYGLNRLHELGLSQGELLEVARPLGADVAFGLVGGVARGTGYGDRLEPLAVPEFLRECPMVLVFPPTSCSTPEVYKLWDKLPSHVARGASDRLLQAASQVALWQQIANDLEEPAFRLRPTLHTLKNKMLFVGLEGVCVSGSGSTLFGFVAPDTDQDRVRQLLEVDGVRVLTTKIKDGTRFGSIS